MLNTNAVKIIMLEKLTNTKISAVKLPYRLNNHELQRLFTKLDINSKYSRYIIHYNQWIILKFTNLY